MSAGQIVAAIGAAALWLAGMSSVLRTLVVARGVTSVLAETVTAVVRFPFRWLASRFARYEPRDTILIWAAPTSMLVLLITWLGLFFTAYALAIFAAGVDRIGGAFVESGSSLFTLGFDWSRSAKADYIDFTAAATGPIVIALQIAYLPTLYAAYNRREVDVTLLQSRAGEPAWGPEILARHKTVDILDSLPAFYAHWERWAADVSESHANYPTLIYFRSPRALRSWLVGLLAVLDSAALYLALCPVRAPSEARLCLRMGFICLRDVAQVVHIRYDPDPHPDYPIELDYDEFLRAAQRLEQVGFPVERSPEDAWPHFRGWRVNYEEIAYRLAWRLDAVPALWSGPRRRSRSAMAPARPADRRPSSRATMS